MASRRLGSSSPNALARDAQETLLVGANGQVVDVSNEPDGTGNVSISSVRQCWVDDFGGIAGAIDPALWDSFPGGQDLVNTPPLIPVSIQGGGVSTGMSAPLASSNMAFAMGTTNGAEWWFLSKIAFSIPVDIFVMLTISQRNTNNAVYFDLVEVDPVTLAIVPNTGATDLHNRAGAVFRAATAASVDIESYTDNGAVYPLTITSQQSTAGNIQTLLEFRNDSIKLSTSVADSSTAKIAAPGLMNRQGIDPNKLYRLRMKFINTGVPTATFVTVYRILIQDIQELTAEITGSRGSQAGADALPVNVVPVAGATANSVQGAFAANASGSPGNPVGVAGLASSAAGGPAALTTARSAVPQFDLAARQVVTLFGNPPSHSPARNVITTTTETTMVAAGGATIRHELQSVIISNRDTVAATVDVRDAVAGTIRFSPVVAPGTTLQLDFPGGWPASALNTAWTAQLRASTTTNGVEVSTSSYETTA